MAEAFEKLTAGLTDEQRADFFQILHNAGVSPRDVELVKFLTALQLYKIYYESIPASMQKTVSEMKQIKTEIEELASQTAQSAEAGETSLNHLRQEAAQVDESLKRLHLHMEEAAMKASVIVAKRMKELVDKMMKEALPLSNMAEAGKTFTDAIKSTRAAAADLRADVKTIRWAHWRVYALSTFLTFTGLLVFMHYRYEMRVDAVRVAAVSKYDEQYRDVLLALSRSNRKLELTADPKNPAHKLLSVRNATGWTSRDNRGVIEIAE